MLSHDNVCFHLFVAVSFVSCSHEILSHSTCLLTFCKPPTQAKKSSLVRVAKIHSKIHFLLTFPNFSIVSNTRIYWFARHSIPKFSRTIILKFRRPIISIRDQFFRTRQPFSTFEMNLERQIVSSQGDSKVIKINIYIWEKKRVESSEPHTQKKF